MSRGDFKLWESLRNVVLVWIFIFSESQVKSVWEGDRMTNISNQVETVRILFVCYGNTCRSPMAEAVMKNLLIQRNMQSKFQIDSAGISEFRNNSQSTWEYNFFFISGGWQADQEINEFARKMLDLNGIPVGHHRARQITIDDFKNFTHIVGMDNYNIRTLTEYQSSLNSECQIILLGNYIPEGDKIIHDPFFENQEKDFIECFRQISISCENFLDEIVQSLN